MAITPDEIENRAFGLVRRGYDPSEVDGFLKEVAATLAQAQADLATPPAAPEEEAEAAPPATDDFGRLGEEVAAILRQAHESVETLRHRAEAEAALIRQKAEEETAALSETTELEITAQRLAAEELASALLAEAEADRTQAARLREATEAEAAVKMAEVDQHIERAAEAAHEAAKSRAREAVAVQRSVRGRLEGTRTDISSALKRLAGEDDELFPAIDLIESELAEFAPPGQEPPSPAVSPPTGTVLDLTNLPYADPDSEMEEGEDPPTLPPVVNSNGDGRSEGGVAAELCDGSDQPDDSDPLDAVVRSAVEGALRRKKGDKNLTEGGAGS